jgi:SAM-dependent methyltransferase
MNVKYTGIDNLEIIAEAKNYNNFLKNEVYNLSLGYSRVLDFGSGIGTFAAALKEKGCLVTCVEPDRTLLQLLKDMGFEAYPDISVIPPESLDCIYSLNVLEHIEDDAGTVVQLYRKLKPGGRLFLYVPAFDILYSSMDKKVGHFRRYRISNLTGLLTDAGFASEKAVYVDSLGFLVTLLYKLIGNDRGDINPRIIRVYDTFFFPVSRLLDRALGHFIGKNIITVARRPEI